MNERIKELRKELGYNQQQFADRLNIKRGTIANYEVGRNEPIDAVVSLICREFNVNEEWLRTGKGKMFYDISREEEIARLTLDLLKEEDDSFKSRVISVLSRMTSEEWKWLEEKAREVVGVTEKE